MAEIQIVLTFDTLSGQMQVAGAIDQTVFALGMLAQAQALVSRHAFEKAASSTPKLVPVSNIRALNGHEGA